MEPIVKTKRQNYNVGMRFCIALAKEAEQRKGEPVPITDAINDLMLSSEYDVWVKTAYLSANAYQESQGLEPLTESEYLNMVDKMGFRALSELIVKLFETFQAVNSQSLDEGEGEQKKSISTGGMSSE